MAMIQVTGTGKSKRNWELIAIRLLEILIVVFVIMGSLAIWWAVRTKTDMIPPSERLFVVSVDGPAGESFIAYQSRGGNGDVNVYVARVGKDGKAAWVIPGLVTKKYDEAWNLRLARVGLILTAVSLSEKFLPQGVQPGDQIVTVNFDPETGEEKWRTISERLTRTAIP